MENMKITQKIIKANLDTFGPELYVTVIIPLEYCMDTTALVGKEEFARSFGRDLLNLIENTPLTEVSL